MGERSTHVLRYIRQNSSTLFSDKAGGMWRCIECEASDWKLLIFVIDILSNINRQCNARKIFDKEIKLNICIASILQKDGFQ